MRRLALSLLLLVLTGAAIVCARAVLSMPADGVPTAGPQDGEREPTEQIAPIPRPTPTRVTHWLDRYLDAEDPTLDDDRDAGPRERRTTIYAQLLWKHSRVAIPGARVRLTRTMLDTVVATTDERTVANHLLDAEAVTDQRGLFELWIPRTDRDLFIRIEHGDHLVDVHKVRHVPQPGQRAYQGELLVAERGRVRGIVVDSDGEPIEGVRVRGVDDPVFGDPQLPESIADARIAGAEHFDPAGMDGDQRVSPWARTRDRLLPFPETETDGSGRFHLGGLRSGKLELILQGDDRIGRRTDLIVVHGQTTDAGRIELRRGRPFVVRVRNGRDRPMPARVAVRLSSWRFGPPPKRTDANGNATFFLPDVREIERERDPETGRWAPGRKSKKDEEKRKIRVLIARGDRYPWERRGHHAFPGCTIQLFTPDTRWTRLRSSSGGAVRGARITTSPSLPRFVAVEGADGQWQLGGLLPAASFLLVARAAEHAPAVCAGSPPSWLQMVRTFPVLFRVVAADGRAISGARIRARFHDKPRHYFETPGTDWHLLDTEPLLGFTDQNGELVAEGIWDTNFTFVADHHEHGEAVSAKPFIPAAGQVVSMTLTRDGGLRGYLSIRGQKPPRRFRVVADRAEDDAPALGDARRFECVTGEDGSYAFEQLAPGRWTIRVVEPRVPDAPAEDVESDPVRRMLEEMAASYERQAWWRPYAKRVIHVIPGQVVHVDIEFQDQDSTREPLLSGLVSIANDPRADVRVRLRTDPRPRWMSIRRRSRHDSGGVTYTAFTDQNGEYRFGDAPIGVTGTLDFELRANDEWLHLTSREVKFYDRKTRDWKRPRVDVDVAVGGILLGLFDADGKPLAGRMFRLTSLSSGTEDSAITLVADRTGTVRHDSLPPGQYRISGRADDADAPSFGVVDLRVVAGEQTVRDLIAHRRRR